MKNKAVALLFIGVFLLAFSTCKKDTDVNMESFKIVKEVEKVTAGTTSATITGMYEYSGRIDGIKVRVGTSEQLFGSDVYVAEMSGKSYSVNITGLRSGTKYHYRYEVDYGAKEDYLTEIGDFTTQSESPTVKTLEVQAIDSTTFRVKCVVDADGGSEVTERGICFNTYGDPTLDDETMQHNSVGTGQYTIRMESLPTNTKYYVRAYAKNGTGIGFGEVLDFKTGGETSKPQVSTVEVNDVTYNAATCLCNVASDGGLELTERGVCWGLEPDPTINVHKVTAEGTETGNYTVTIEGLNPNADYHVRAYAINEKGIAYGEDLPFTTTDGKPTVTTSAVTDITATSATGGGNVTDEGATPVTERGICWSTSHEPTTSGSHTQNGTGAGSYTCDMTALVPNETYYVRAYVTNGQGTAYGAEVEFTAREGMPVVVTLDMTDITATSAKAHGKVTDQGGSVVTERGICWSTEPSPTISGSHTQSGTGAGEYTVDMTGLVPGTKYYVRAYAINAQGMTYGGQEDFTTLATLPTVVTGSISGTTVSGEVTSEGGATVTERGVCWSTSHTPTIEGSHGSSGSGLGTFSVELTDLAPGTTYYVRAYATNSAGTAYGSEKTLTTQATPPTVTTGEVTNIGQNTAQGSGNVTSDGGAEVTERGVCWSTSLNPTINGSHASNGTGTGGFTVNMTGLTANTHYYVRAYAKNSAGVSYGNEVDFTTAQNVSAPTVTTSQVTNVTQTTATGGGNVTNNGGATVTERGICWSTSHYPTTSGSHANSGTGTGSFTVNMTGLTPGTTYYVRAYAKNSAGTAYGTEVSFTTDQAVTLPTVTTAQVTNIQQTTATGGGNVTNNGGATVTERGICWGMSHNPTTSGSHATSGTGTGSFTVNMTGLTANTTYYVRAYAKNSAGTQYGTEVSFTTSQSISAPTVTTAQVTNIAQTTATGGGNVTNDGGANVTERGICWGTGHNPTTSGSHASNGTGTGSYTVNMTGLASGTTYYVRAYAINSQGTSYGSEVSFTTQVAVTTPTVTTAQVTNITQTTATGGGNVTASGNATVTARGICWGTGHNPTVSGSHAQASQGGTGSYTVNMTGLTANTTYYVRAYATNSAGTAYGTEVSFTTLSSGGNVPQGAINGLFTINANGDQVYFSQGNLQYQASTNTWRFATNQYDYIGDANSNISQNYSGWIDLFGWGTSGYNHGAVCYQPWSTIQNDGDYYAYGQYTYNLYDQTGQADWGYNAISNGGNTTNRWRTLTGGNGGEWKYLFDMRSTPSGIRYAKAQVNGVNGVILLPDDWSASYYSLSNTNQGGASFTDNVISASQWNTLEEHGAVFLPAAGNRNGVNVVDGRGDYWTASCKSSKYAYSVNFYDTYLITVNDFNRFLGFSVRLVRVAE